MREDLVSSWILQALTKLPFCIVLMVLHSSNNCPGGYTMAMSLDITAPQINWQLWKIFIHYARRSRTLVVNSRHANIPTMYSALTFKHSFLLQKPQEHYGNIRHIMWVMYRFWPILDCFCLSGPVDQHAEGVCTTALLYSVAKIIFSYEVGCRKKSVLLV